MCAAFNTIFASFSDRTKQKIHSKYSRIVFFLLSSHSVGHAIHLSRITKICCVGFFLANSLALTHRNASVPCKLNNRFKTFDGQAVESFDTLLNQSKLLLFIRHNCYCCVWGGYFAHGCVIFFFSFVGNKIYTENF